MIIGEIAQRLQKQTARISDATQKLLSAKEALQKIETDISKCQNEGAADQALPLMQKKRDVENEIQALRSVITSIGSPTSPLISKQELCAAWAEVTVDCKQQCDNMMQDIQAAFDQYNQKVEALFGLRRQVGDMSVKLKKLAARENIEIYLPDPFEGENLTMYWPGDKAIEKPNCVTVSVTTPLTLSPEKRGKARWS
jgi:DNA repair exonuclease SbcCD ATPase subunit